MNRSILHLLTTIVLCLTAACTHNDGDIGTWFGQWKVTAITVDGAPEPDYDGNIFWSFQAHVVQMVEVVDDLRQNTSWGSWEESGDELLLDFGHSDAGGDANSYRYTPPAALHLTKGVNRLHVNSISGSKGQLTYNAADGHVYTYHIKKWG